MPVTHKKVLAKANTTIDTYNIINDCYLFLNYNTIKLGFIYPSFLYLHNIIDSINMNYNKQKFKLINVLINNDYPKVRFNSVNNQKKAYVREKTYAVSIKIYISIKFDNK